MSEAAVSVIPRPAVAICPMNTGTSGSFWKAAICASRSLISPEICAYRIFFFSSIFPIA